MKWPGPLLDSVQRSDQLNQPWCNYLWLTGLKAPTDWLLQETSWGNQWNQKICLLIVHSTCFPMPDWIMGPSQKVVQGINTYQNYTKHNLLLCVIFNTTTFWNLCFWKKIWIWNKAGRPQARRLYSWIFGITLYSFIFKKKLENWNKLQQLSIPEEAIFSFFLNQETYKLFPLNTCNTKSRKIGMET